LRRQTCREVRAVVPPDLDRLIDRAEGALREAAVGREALPSCAYLLDGDGEVEALAFPVPDDDAGRDALAAVLAMHLDRVGARMWVLALPTRRRVGGRSCEFALLDGHALGGEGPVRRSRLLRVERRRGAIAVLHPGASETRPVRRAERARPDGSVRR
jgi:hypothetical protein